jgi:hypothetical protein
MTKKKFKLLALPSVNNTEQAIARFSFPIDLTMGQINKIEINFQGEQANILYDHVDIRKFSFIWLCSSWETRDLSYAIQLYLDHYKIPHTPVEQGTSKLTDYMTFFINKIPTPNTLFLGSRKIERFLDQIKNICDYPLVIKDTKGSCGTDMVKVMTEKELLKKIKKMPKHKKYFFQQYIPNEYDWGIMVANGKVVSGEKSYPCKGEFRNNACNGAKEIFIDKQDIPKHIRQTAIKASATLNLSWSRTDILINKENEKHTVLEVNRLPGITSKTSEVDGAFIFLSSQIKP